MTITEEEVEYEIAVLRVQALLAEENQRLQAARLARRYRWTLRELTVIADLLKWGESWSTIVDEAVEGYRFADDVLRRTRWLTARSLRPPL